MGMGSEIQLQLQTKHNGIIFATHSLTHSLLTPYKAGADNCGAGTNRYR